MAVKKPICNYDGSLKELQSSDTLPGALLYVVESESESSPNDTVFVSQITPSQASTNADIVIRPKGSGAILAQIPDGTTAGGNKRGTYAVDFQMQRGGAADRVASGSNSGILCGTSNKASGTSSAVIGGDNNQVSGQNSVSIGGSSNNNAGSSSVTIGYGNTISTGTYSVLIGYLNTVGASNCYIIGTSNTGYSNNTVIGQNNTTGSNAYVMQIGWHQAANLFVNNRYTQAFGLYAQNQIPYAQHFAGGRFAATGDANFILAHIFAITTDNSLTEMFCGNTALQRMVIPNDTTWSFRAMVTARRTDIDNESAAWEVTGCIDNNANVVALVGAPTVTTIADDSTGQWTIAAVADNTNKALVFNAAGQASKTIRWKAVVFINQVTG